MKKNSFALVLILVVVLFFTIVVGYFLFNNELPQKLEGWMMNNLGNTSVKVDDKLSNDTPAFVRNLFSKISLTLSEVPDMKNERIHVYMDNNGVLYWMSPEDYLIKVVDSPQFVITYDCVGGQSEKFEKIASILNQGIEKIFLQNSFEKYLKGTYSDDMWKLYPYSSSSSNLNCLVMVDLLCGGTNADNMRQNLNIVCNDNDNYKKGYNAQVPILRDLKIKNGVLDQVENYGNFYSFFSRWIFGAGATMIAQKTDSGWVKLLEGQDYFSCDLVNKYKIPHQLHAVEQCYDSKTGGVVENLN